MNGVARGHGKPGLNPRGVSDDRTAQTVFAVSKINVLFVFSLVEIPIAHRSPTPLFPVFVDVWRARRHSFRIPETGCTSIFGSPALRDVTGLQLIPTHLSPMLGPNYFQGSGWRTGKHLQFRE